MTRSLTIKESSHAPNLTSDKEIEKKMATTTTTNKNVHRVEEKRARHSSIKKELEESIKELNKDREELKKLICDINRKDAAGTGGVRNERKNGERRNERNEDKSVIGKGKLKCKENGELQMKTTTENKMATERKNTGKATQQKDEKNEPEYRRHDTFGIVCERKKRQEELQKQNDEKEATITALRIEIDNFKSKVAEQKEMIEDLTEDRDVGWNEVYKLKLELADAWDITLETESEKVREVSRLRRDNKAKKSYCAAAKEAITNTQIKNNEIKTDSGIDVQSLEKLIDERVSITINTKFEHIKKKNDTVESDEFTKAIYTNNAEINHDVTPATNGRELKLIVHGIEESGTHTETNSVVKELFETLEVKHHPTILADRLGEKSLNKNRPIRITMESDERKIEIMSKLWKLKYGPGKFLKISITDDFTQEERKEIKRWVDEAKERTKKENGYVWKIRGSPRSKLYFIKLRV